jgi:HEAT repeat protein
MLSGEREPEYNGRTLSQWVEIYEVSFNPMPAEEDPPKDSAARREAVEAAHHLRDKILPRALRLLRAEKPQWKNKVEHVMEMNLDVRRWCPLWVWGPFYGDRGEDSVVYFEMLGPDAGSAVPELARIMRQADSSRVRERAMFALACVGKEGLPPLMEVLGDPQNPDRRRAAYALLNMKRAAADQQAAVASPAVPLLIKSLKDPDRNVSTAGATVLGELALDADIAVPALADCLGAADNYLQEEAAEALGQFGDRARFAVPALIKALDDSEPSVRESATNALVKISPQVLGGKLSQ